MKNSKFKINLKREMEFTVPKEILNSRIKNIQKRIGRTEIVILFSNVILDKPNSIYFEFRQNSDFFYLTGMEIRPAVLLILKEEVLLFYDNPNPKEEIWTGIQPDHQEIKKYLDYLSVIFSYDEFKNKLLEYLKNKTKIYYPFGLNSHFDVWLLEILESKMRKGRTGIFYPYSIEHSNTLMFELRIIKSDYEIRTIKEIMEITKEAHLNVWKYAKPNLKEYELDSLIWKTFKKYNAKPAYPNIVASGPNACILHYTKNSRTIKENDLVLIDAGASKFYLNTDITRTFPANGTFNPIQKFLYEVVLTAQTKAIEKVTIGNCMEDAHYAALSVIIDFLKQEKILEGSIEEIIEKETYHQFYPHRTGHWLGYDVHDSGFYLCYTNSKKNLYCKNELHSQLQKESRSIDYRKFESNMICTVEPGLYFPYASKKVPKEWLGIGIRIEDDVLVTKTKPIVLSKDIPKETSDIETIMQLPS
ncbi:MAG: aminopeptidase P family protein [Leptonema sp. (in: bacteria)]